MRRWVFHTRSLSRPCTENPERRRLELEQQSLCRRRKGPEHLRLNTCLEGRSIKTDGVTSSRGLIDGKQRPHVGQPFFAVGLGSTRRCDAIGEVGNLPRKVVNLIKGSSQFFPIRSDRHPRRRVELERGVKDQFAV